MYKLLLYPFSLIYGLIIVIRNWLYNRKVFHSTSFEHPVISVGNLTTGGTGKTPHIEYLIKLLSGQYRIATLSRGYGRKTRGFMAGNQFSTAKEIGDEPLQFARKFSHVQVVVDENRVHGISEILYRYPATDVILLDDAFQHRAVKPGLSILLTDFYNLYSDDHLLPSGSLREPRSAAKRADIIIVTKTREIFSPITRRRLTEALRILPHQKIFFSYLQHGNITPVGKKECASRKQRKYNTIFMFAGIANTYPLEDHLRKNCIELVSLTFPDHHYYTVKDIERIKKAWSDIYTPNKLMVTTEKDLMRLQEPGIWELIVNLPLHYIPIEVEFHDADKNQFDQEILNYVRTTKENH